MIGILFADKDRELGDQRSEIKALKYSDRLKGKAVEEVCLNPFLTHKLNFIIFIFKIVPA